jgi:hypothetical protein
LLSLGVLPAIVFILAAVSLVSLINAQELSDWTTHRLEIGVIRFFDAGGKQDYHNEESPLVNAISAGRPVIVNGLVMNQNHTGEHFDYVTQVYDHSGRIEYIYVRYGVAVPFGGQTPIDSSSPLILNETGGHLVKVFAAIGLEGDSPQLASKPKSEMIYVNQGGSMAGNLGPSNSQTLNEALERSVSFRFLENGTKVTYFKNPTYFDEGMLQAYVDMKSAKLKQISSDQPDKEIQAAVSFKHPVSQGKALEIVEQYSLKVEYYEFVATDYGGGASSLLYPDFVKVEGWNVGGVTYIIANATASAFEELNQNDEVILVDIAFILEIEEASKQGGIARQSPPRNLYEVECTTGWIC